MTDKGRQYWFAMEMYYGDVIMLTASWTDGVAENFVTWVQG